MTRNLKQLLANRVREIRQFRGLSQRELAKRLGIGSSSISNIENCKRNVTIETVEKIARELGVNATDLLGVTAENGHPPQILLDTANKYPTIPESVITVYKTCYENGVEFGTPEDYYYLWVIMEALNDKKL